MIKTLLEAEDFFAERAILGIKPGLERVHALLEEVGHPERALKGIHIAGTNGKGSTANFLMDGLIESGYTVGFFTSPSFSGLRGHMFINHEQISETDFLGVLNKLLPAIDKLDQAKMEPTEFEIITVLAFMYLEKRADIAVIEAGMGGRFDTTNCFDPILSIITNVAKDHTAFLGNTIEQIASHKAGIIKTHRPIITGEMSDMGLAVIEKESIEKSAPHYHLGKDFNIYNANGSHFEWTGKNKKHFVKLTMHGSHQTQNAALAIMALELLSENHIAINVTKAIDAMYSTTVAGRFEVISTQPLIVLDGAHNPDGIKAFTAEAADFAKNKQTHIIFSAFKDKEIDKMLDLLQKQFEFITLVPFNHPRSMSENELAQLASSRGLEFNADWKKTISAALKAEETCCTFITGSLHFILRSRAYLLQINGQ